MTLKANMYTLVIHGLMLTRQLIAQWSKLVRLLLSVISNGVFFAVRARS